MNGMGSGMEWIGMNGFEDLGMEGNKWMFNMDQWK